jgi:hypothetical protein
VRGVYIEANFSVNEGATVSRVIGVVCYEPATCAGARPVPLVTDVARKPVSVGRDQEWAYSNYATYEQGDGSIAGNKKG